jgi:hypothetical protein
MASKLLIGIGVGCVVIGIGVMVVVVGGGWYLKHKVEQKYHEMSAPTVTQMWKDVPQMDQMSKSDMDMPVTMKIVVQPLMNRILGAGKSSGDWIVFTTTKKPDDIKKFYTNERMTKFGNWEQSKKSTCITGESEGIPQVGLFCVFEKRRNDRQIGLAIITSEYEQNKPLNVFFLRVDNPAESNTQPASTSP